MSACMCVVSPSSPGRNASRGFNKNAVLINLASKVGRAGQVTGDKTINLIFKLFIVFFVQCLFDFFGILASGQTRPEI